MTDEYPPRRRRRGQPKFGRFATLASMAKEQLEPSATCAAEPVPPDSTHSDRAHIPLLLVLFIGSGCAALIYEIVWFQLLQLVVGSSAVSLGILLGSDMGGRCLGSLLLPRYVSAYK